MRAGIYCRISRDDERTQAGVERQEADCRRKAGEKGWDVAKVYVDNDFSAWSRTKVRPAYQEMVRDFEAGKIDAVVIWHLDRAYRQMLELEQLFQIADARGAESQLASCFGDYQLDNSDHRFNLRIMVSVAQKESDDKSRRTLRKQQQLAENGLIVGGGFRPFGFQADRLTINPDEAVLIQEAARRILAGETQSAIVRDWTRRGIKSPAGKDWNTRSLHNMLKSPRVAGKIEHRTGTYAAAWSPILDETTHARIVTLFSDPSRASGGLPVMKYLLSGVVYCGLCGRTLLSRPRYRKEERIRNYICPSPNHADRPGCGRIRIDADPLEEQVLEQIIANEWRLGTESPEGEDSQVVKEAIEQEILSDQQTVSQFARDFADGLIDRDTYMETRQAIGQRVEANKRRLLGVAGQAQAQTDWRTYLEASHEPMFPLGEAEFAAWRSSIALMVDRVVVGKSNGKRGEFDPMRVTVEWREQEPLTWTAKEIPTV